MADNYASRHMSKIDSFASNSPLALLILRTPFQAWLAERVLEQEAVKHFDLVYFTQNDSPEDRYYFARLSAHAGHSQYCFVSTRWPDIRNHLAFRHLATQWFQKNRYDKVLLSSIDALVPNSLAAQNRGELVTFDDGSANIYPDSSYCLDSPSWRTRLYRRLFGALDIATTCARIARHYTLHPDLDNIVEKNRIKGIAAWPCVETALSAGFPLKVFIGQPFFGGLSEQQIASLQQYLANERFDYYVRHPRESELLTQAIPLLDKGGRIAEDAILHTAEHRALHVTGWFSSVLFNLRGAARRTMILFQNDPRTPTMAKLARQVGCEIVLL